MTVENFQRRFATVASASAKELFVLSMCYGAHVFDYGVVVLG